MPLFSAELRIDGLVNNAGVNFPRLLVDEKHRPAAI